MKLLKVSIVTLKGLEYDGFATYVGIKNSDQYLGILPEHMAIISDIAKSRITIKETDKELYFDVDEGVFSLEKDYLNIIVSSASKVEQ